MLVLDLFADEDRRQPTRQRDQVGQRKTAGGNRKAELPTASEHVTTEGQDLLVNPHSGGAAELFSGKYPGQ
jgi:hypothetical protein